MFCVEVCFRLDIYLGVDLLSLCQPFEELPHCFTKWLYHFTFLPAVYEGSSFSTLHQHLRLFDYSHPSGCEVVSHCAFDFLVIFSSFVLNFSKLKDKQILLLRFLEPTFSLGSVPPLFPLLKMFPVSYFDWKITDNVK